jgi:hypothetical protein
MATSKELFFGLVKENRKHHLDDDEFDLFFINNSDNPVTIKRKSYGGFTTFEDVVAMSTPKDDDVNIVVDAHSYIRYRGLSRGMNYDDFEGVNQYQTIVEVDGVMKLLEFYLDDSGYLGSLVPVINKYGRSIYPTIEDYNGDK